MSDVHYWDPVKDSEVTGEEWLTQCGEWVGPDDAQSKGSTFHSQPVTCTACILLDFQASATGEPFYTNDDDTEELRQKWG